MKKYSTEDILKLSYTQWITLMCDELNKAGIRRLRYDIEFEYSPDIFEGGIMHHEKALNYLKEIGLIDNGRCTKCGRPYKERNFTVSSYINNNLTVFICKDCHNNGVSFQQNLRSTQSTSNSGCMSSILFCGIIILIISIFI